MIFPPLPTMKALAALQLGDHFSLFDNDRMGVRIAPNRWVEVTSHALADLTERGWVRLGEDDPETGVPTSLILTEQGKYALTRYITKTKTEISFTEPEMVQ